MAQGRTFDTAEAKAHRAARLADFPNRARALRRLGLEVTCFDLEYGVHRLTAPWLPRHVTVWAATFAWQVGNTGRRYGWTALLEYLRDKQKLEV